MKRWKPNDTACTNGNDCIPLDTNNTEAEAEAEAEAETEAETESTAPPAAMPAPPEPKNDKPERHKHGQYGWVRLSDEEYNRLSNDLGETELKRCIAYIDESAQSSGNKNRWRDWNLVIRRCHRDGWGKNKGTSRNAVKTAADYENGDDFLSC